MLIAFEIKMTNWNTWNGAYTGANDRFIRVHNMLKKDTTFMKGKEEMTYHHDFGDGWGLNIVCYQVDSKKKKALLKASKGFKGYDWMVRSIIKNNCIKWEEQ